MSAPRIFHDGRVALYPGDCLATLDVLSENSVDSVVCDPPYHLHSIVDRFAKTGRTESTATKSGPHQRTATGFMGKQWDGGDIAFRVETWAKVLRVLKPGGYILAFSSSRTFGRMSVAIEDAGFITHPMIGWIFGSGFPKATRIKAEGFDGQRYGAQSMKPALEPIYMGQKPFSEDTGTANILRWGTGAVNIDACRVAYDMADTNPATNPLHRKLAGYANANASDAGSSSFSLKDGTGERNPSMLGRWPANVITDGSVEVLAAFPQSGASFARPRNNGAFKSVAKGHDKAHITFGHEDDGGSAARFFYATKADDDDRLNSRHPTVKPLDLIQYLVRLITPKGGTVLDCFAGTGTTGHAALIEGCRAILCEREPEYLADIERRMALVFAGRDERRGRLATPAADHGPLFGSVA